MLRGRENREDAVMQPDRPARLFARCSLALALGLLIGPYSTGRPQTAVAAGALVAILNVALVVGVMANGVGGRALVTFALAAAALCALGAGFAMALVWLVGWTRGAPDLLVTVAIFLGPVAAGCALGYVAGRDGQFFKSATLVGMFAWLGIVCHGIALWVVGSNVHRSGDAGSSASAASQRFAPPALNLAGIVLTGVALLISVGFVYAAGMGLLGAAIRRAAVRLTSGR